MYRRGTKTLRTWAALIAAVAVLAIAVPATAQDDTNPYFEAGAAEGSGEGLKIGYISLGDSIPFVKLVSDNIKEQAEIAGVDLAGR